MPPHPEIERRPAGGFGWLDARLLREGWLTELGPDAAAVLVLLAIAADRHGASYYSRARMAVALGCARDQIDAALEGLLAARLVALRPWRRDGYYVACPMAECSSSRCTRIGTAMIG